jgi:hypothetical protein
VDDDLNRIIDLAIGLLPGTMAASLQPRGGADDLARTLLLFFTHPLGAFAMPMVCCRRTGSSLLFSLRSP